MGFIKGDVSVMSIAHLLQWVEICGKTGTVLIKNPGAEKKIYAENGRIIFVSSTREGERLGEFLHKGSHLDLDKIKSALLQAQTMKISFTQRLLKMNYFNMSELNDIIVTHSQEILMDAVQWNEGTFEFIDGELPSEVLCGPIKLNTPEIISRIFRRLEDSETGLIRKNIQYFFILKQQ